MSKAWYEKGVEAVRLYGAISLQLIIINELIAVEPKNRKEPFSDAFLADMKTAHGKLDEVIVLLIPHMTNKRLANIADKAKEYKAMWESEK